MHIFKIKDEEEVSRKALQDLRFKERICKHIGLRWLIEAMLGSELSGVNTRLFARTMDDEPAAVDPEVAQAEFDRIRESLEGRKTVLVGHNLFTDLIYFHQCFFGSLPESVDDFSEATHELFPMYVADYHTCRMSTLP
jgi:poly(A)-specific ribonuclease